MLYKSHMLLSNFGLLDYFIHFNREARIMYSKGILGVSGINLHFSTLFDLVQWFSNS